MKKNFVSRAGSVARFALLPLIASLVLAGCSTTPTFEPVAAPSAPATFKELDGRWAALAPAESQARGEWWKAFGDPVTNDPIRALVTKVSDVDAREVIILTRPHVVSEFFHADWTSRARRKLGVPVLHLLEHENFDEQAGEGEGISGF